MPLHILIAMVVGGIAAIGFALHLLGKSTRVLLDEESARTAWARQFPDDPAIAVLVSADGHAALVETARGRGLVWSFGADTVARQLDHARLEQVEGGLRVRFADFTAPVVTISVSDEQRAFWRAAARS